MNLRVEFRQGRKPIIVSHAMVPGLLEGQEKMSKVVLG